MTLQSAIAAAITGKTPQEAVAIRKLCNIPHWALTFHETEQAVREAWKQALPPNEISSVYGEGK
jgi:hypothetical protein